MIYTLGKTDNYERYYKEQGSLWGKGIGGTVWRTYWGAASARAKGFTVYGVKADFEKDTVADRPTHTLPEMSEERSLIVDAPLVRVVDLQPAEDTDNYVGRLVSRGVEVGFAPVMYGMRLRAGYAGGMGCCVDWCCGDSYTIRMVCLGALMHVLNGRPYDERVFSGVPPYSHVKPVHADYSFWKKVWADYLAFMEQGEFAFGRMAYSGVTACADLRHRYFKRHGLAL